MLAPPPGLTRMWSPTHVQFTVLRARNLLAKGKGGNNDVFVTIQLAKEKFQTSTIKSARSPEWFEECDLPIRDMQSEVQVCLYHRGVLSDDFLGYAAVPLWDHKILETPVSRWIPLQNKPTKSSSNKYRGEVEIKLAFRYQSRQDLAGAPGLQKRSSSIRNLATAFGEKLKLTRSRSLREIRENRQDSEMARVNGNLLSERADHKVVQNGKQDSSTRNGSVSTAYIKPVSLDRGQLVSCPVSSLSVSNVHSSTLGYHGGMVQDFPYSGVSQLHSQSLYNLPGNRRSCADVPFHSPPPPPYDLKASSKDDSVLTFKNRQTSQEHQMNPTFRIPPPPNMNQTDPIGRERSGIYESIKEKTEPENSASSSDPESVPMPKTYARKFIKMNFSSVENSNRDYSRNHAALTLPNNKRNSNDQQSFSCRDSGILDDRSPSLGNSLESSIATADGTNSGSKAIHVGGGTSEGRTETSKGVGSQPSQPDKDVGVVGVISRSRGRVKVPSNFYTKETSQGELVVRKRSRGQRDRLHQIRQANRRYTVQGLESGASGLFEESPSEPSDSSRPEVSDDLVSIFKNMTREELLRVVITTKAQMIRKDQYIRDLENYVDDLLVRVMETTPRLLGRQPFRKL